MTLGLENAALVMFGRGDHGYDAGVASYGGSNLSSGAKAMLAGMFASDMGASLDFAKNVDVAVQAVTAGGLDRGGFGVA